MANDMDTLTSRLVSELTTGLTGNYANLYVARGLFRPAALPTFDRYAIIVSPAPRPWDERRVAVPKIQYTLRVDLYVLVKNWEQTDNPLFGTAAGNRGLFELVNDIKVLLRLSNLSGLLDKTYDEPGGDPSAQGAGGMEFQDTIPGFDTAEHALVHRVRIPYQARMEPFCHPRL